MNYMDQKLWVEFSDSIASKVSTVNCDDLDDYMKACKDQLSIAAPVSRLLLSTTRNGDMMKPPDMTIKQFITAIGKYGFSADNTLHIRVKEDETLLEIEPTKNGMLIQCDHFIITEVVFSHAQLVGSTEDYYSLSGKRVRNSELTEVGKKLKLNPYTHNIFLVEPLVIDAPENGCTLFQRDKAALQLLNILLPTGGVKKTAVLDQCFGSGKTLFCYKFRSLISECPKHCNEKRYNELMNAVYVRIDFSITGNPQPLPYIPPFNRILEALKQSFSQNFSNCKNIDDLLLEIKGLGSTKKVFLHFDEVGVYDMDPAIAIPFIREIWEIGEKLRKYQGYFYVICGRSDYSHTIGVGSLSSISPSPAELVNLSLLSEDSILKMASGKQYHYTVFIWLEKNLYGFCKFSGGVPRFVHFAFLYLSEKAIDEDISDIKFDDESMWGSVLSQTNSIRKPNIGCILLTILELALSKYEFRTDCVTLKGEAFTSVLVRYGVYFTPGKTKDLSVVMMPECLLRFWIKSDPEFLNSIDNLEVLKLLDKGSRLEYGFLRALELRFRLPSESWRSVGLSILDESSVPFPAEKLLNAYIFPKISSQSKRATEEQIQNFMTVVHEKKDMAQDKQVFHPDDLPYLFSRMKIGQYYEPLPLSSSADAFIALNANSMLHIQLKNLQSPISDKTNSDIEKELEKCCVAGWYNYCLIVWASGHASSRVAPECDEIRDYQSKNDPQKKVRGIILSKKSVDYFFGKFLMEKLAAESDFKERPKRFPIVQSL